VWGGQIGGTPGACCPVVVAGAERRAEAREHALPVMFSLKQCGSRAAGRLVPAVLAGHGPAAPGGIVSFFVKCWPSTKSCFERQ